jgi:hypothetical protein
MSDTIRRQLSQWYRAGLAVGAVGIVASVLGLAVDSHRFFISYLFAYVFWLGLALGCFEVAMIHHLTGGKWGFVVRRFLEAGFMTLPLMAVLFVPLLFGMRTLYPWARPEAVAASTVLQHKQVYLNTPAFAGRAVFFFGCWIGAAYLLRKWSLMQDRSADPAPTIRLRTLCGPGVVLYPVTGTFAFIDWVMSIEPAWYSTIFLVILIIGQILMAFSWTTVLLARWAGEKPFVGVVTTTHFHDLGNLLLAFVVFWTYVSFSQLLIIYSGNLPREIDWYLHRIAGGWKWVVGFLALFHFFVPFFLLLFRTTKQRSQRLALIAAALLCVHIVAVYWVVVPTFQPTGPRLHWLDLAVFLGIGGWWVAGFAALLRRQTLLPQNDPRIDYALPSLAHAK